MKVLVFEDEAPAARKIVKLIKEYDPEIEIMDVVESVKDGLRWFETNQPPDLIFSDIQLSDNLSFEIFRKLDLKVPVIFTTAYNEYAIEAFRHFSIDYLLKPIRIENLAQSIDKYKEFGNRQKRFVDFESIISRLKGEDYRSRFLVHYRDGLIPIDTHEIAYFYSEESITFMMRNDGKSFIITDSLDALESQLNPRIFFRANRKFILSSDSIIKVEPYFGQKLIAKVMPDIEAQITISKNKATSFKDWLNS